MHPVARAKHAVDGAHCQHARGIGQNRRRGDERENGKWIIGQQVSIHALMIHKFARFANASIKFINAREFAWEICIGKIYARQRHRSSRCAPQKNLLEISNHFAWRRKLLKVI